MDINTLLKGINCSCGKRHDCSINKVYIEKNAIERLTEACAEFNNVLIVCDENTFKAAGEKTLKALKNKNVKTLIFSGETVVIPDEDAVDRVNKNMADIDLIIAIGSGVMQDLCKYVSFNTKVPYFVVATAPSMDGYASSGAAMIMGGMKITYSSKVPEAIFADTEVLKNSPIDMIKAGYGDIIGKYSALNDWKLSSIVNKEFYCDYIYNLMFDALKNTLPLAKKLLERDEESIGILMEALVIAGIAMSFLGNSRPASGSEHHLSHFFEITGILNNEEYFTHGVDVLYSTFITAKIREKLVTANFSDKLFKMEDNAYKSEIQRVYSNISDECIALHEKTGLYKNDKITIYKENEVLIKKTLSEVPKSEIIKNIIDDIGLDINEFYKLYGDDKINDAITYAKDLKDRYTVLWLYYDLFGTNKI